MKRSTSICVAVLSMAVAFGCSESASVEDADLTNAEAAAMVEEETSLPKEESAPTTPEEATSDAAAASVTPVVFNVEDAPTITFDVPDMMCEHSCVPTVRETLAKQPGVKDVKVELETKTATVAVDKDQFDPDAAVAALVDLQFTETKLHGSPAEKAQN